MISYWVTRSASFGIDTYRQHRGRAIGERFRPSFYDEICQGIHLSAGPQIFSALDQLTDTHRRAVAQIWDAHARTVPAATRLNDPRRVLLRFNLLTRLYEERINAFRVWRAADLEKVDRFPLFIRSENDHSGPRSGLLHTRKDAARAVLALRLRGFRLENLMLAEFCDTRGADGLFRKYAAFKVGDTIIACHAMVSRRWLVKSGGNEPDEARIQEEMAFIESNPHESWLRRVCAIAGIGYGRVDYGVVDGVPQVWEINLNPTLGRASGGQRHASLAPKLKALRERGREAFHARLRAAFLALDTGDDRTSVPVSIDRTLLDQLAAEAAEGQRRRRIVGGLRDLYERPGLGLAARFVYARLFPRR